jgi:glycerol kinase
MPNNLVLALDQGTTSSRAILFGHDGKAVATAQQEFPQIYPKPGDVEHDPKPSWSSQLKVAQDCLKQAGAAASDVQAIGITNQRETTVLWDKHTGKPVANAIVWQSRVSAPDLRRAGRRPATRISSARDGPRDRRLLLGTKVAHLLKTIPGLKGPCRERRHPVRHHRHVPDLAPHRRQAPRHRRQQRQPHADVRHPRLDWDDELLRILGVPRKMLPEVRASSEVYGETDARSSAARSNRRRRRRPAGALFGQACFEPGTAKNTYGTGCFMLLNTGRPRCRRRTACSPRSAGSSAARSRTRSRARSSSPARSCSGCATACGDHPRRPRSRSSRAGARLRRRLPVPAFVGLGAPHWDAVRARHDRRPHARHDDRHLARAALDSMAYQTRDVLDAMQKDAGIALAGLKVDGGAAVNNG